MPLRPTREELEISFEKDDAPKKNNPEKRSKRAAKLTAALFAVCRVLTAALCFLTVMYTAFFRFAVVSGSSMSPTLKDSDVLLLRCVYYGVERGDCVVISRESRLEEPLLKRVVAVGGDTVYIDREQGGVYVNGLLVEEPYVVEDMGPVGDYVFPVTVPYGCVFVMGDNRNDSMDSRFSSIGFIPEKDVFGKVILRIFPDPGAIG
ncbi:MAG: signal peptidase I [Clostridia bacterium]|nr:signal peptidase I [Clostridia bacterium]